MREKMTQFDIHPLRAMRERLNLTQKRLAEEIGVGVQTILRAEHNKPIQAESRRLLCEYFGMTSEELGLNVAETSPPDPQTESGEQVNETPPLPQVIAQGIVLAAQELENQAMETSRRNFIQALGMTGTILIVPSSASANLQLPPPPLWERLYRALEKPSQIDEITLLHLEASARDCWQLLPDVLGTFSHAMLKHVLDQLEIVTKLLESFPSIEARLRLASVAGELAQVAGEILFDVKENIQAEHYYNTALEAARVAQDRSMQAMILGRKSFIPIYDHNAQRALPFLEEAHALASIHTSNYTRAWLFAVEAEAQANTFNEKGCLKALEQAEYHLEHAQPGETTNPRFSQPTLLGYKGVCHLKLKQPQIAQHYLEESLTTMSIQRIRHRAIVLIDMATTYLQQGEIDEACRYAAQALNIIAQMKSARVFQRIINFRKLLDPWKKTQVVKYLDEQIAAVSPFIARWHAS
jgi:transcriptional regulator with XRE-family HTH domain